MLKVSEAKLLAMDELRPGLREMVLRFEAADLPSCPACGSEDTASVRVGLVGILLESCFATSKVTLVANGPKPGEFRCHACTMFFS